MSANINLEQYGPLHEKQRDGENIITQTGGTMSLS